VDLDKKVNDTNLINYATQTFIKDSKLNTNQVIRKDKNRIYIYKNILLLLKPDVSKIIEVDNNHKSALNIIKNKGYIGEELNHFFNNYLAK
jgi:hypothetical protein